MFTDLPVTIAIDDARWGRTTYRYDRVGQLVEAWRGKLHEPFEARPRLEP